MFDAFTVDENVFSFHLGVEELVNPQVSTEKLRKRANGKLKSTQSYLQKMKEGKIGVGMMRILFISQYQEENLSTSSYFYHNEPSVYICSSNIGLFQRAFSL